MPEPTPNNSDFTFILAVVLALLIALAVRRGHFRAVAVWLGLTAEDPRATEARPGAATQEQPAAPEPEADTEAINLELSGLRRRSLSLAP